MIKLGVLGLDLFNPQNEGRNLGCYALSYSFFEILSKIAKEDNKRIEVLVILPTYRKRFVTYALKKVLLNKIDSRIPHYKKLYPFLDFSIVYYLKNNFNIRFGKNIKKCNCVFDFTAGDSFTDLYGEARFYTRTRIKGTIIDYHIPLILGSQTIGPFRNKEVEKYAVDIIERCEQVFVRDQISKSYVERISKAKTIKTTDIAFLLPYTKTTNNNKKKKAGFNPSGLLWMGGYDGNNQFNLTVDYQEFCKSIIQFLIACDYEVHLVLHAFFVKDVKGYYQADNDRLAVDSLHNTFPGTIVSPEFRTPMEAKSYISGMDLFIGARMHATIAAFSIGIPVIPFSYSRKFEGLFSSFNYPFVVEGTKWDTILAINNTKDWITNISIIKRQLENSKEMISAEKANILNCYRKVINNMDSKC